MLKRLQYFIFISIPAVLFSVWMYHFKSSISVHVVRSVEKNYSQSNVSLYVWWAMKIKQIKIGNYKISKY